MGRPKGTTKYAAERASFNVLLPTAFISKIDQIARDSKPRKSRAQVATELIQMGLLFRGVHRIVSPLVEDADLGDDLVAKLSDELLKGLAPMSPGQPFWFEELDHGRQSAAHPEQGNETKPGRAA